MFLVFTWLPLCSFCIMSTQKQFFVEIVDCWNCAGTTVFIHHCAGILTWSFVSPVSWEVDRGSVLFFIDWTLFHVFNALISPIQFLSVSFLFRCLPSCFFEKKKKKKNFLWSMQCSLLWQEKTAAKENSFFFSHWIVLSMTKRPAVGCLFP